MPGEPEPAVPVASPRRGLATWPIRRKLIALVAGPLVLILGAGIFFTAQAVGSLRGAQQARDLANVALLTSQMSGAENTELTATISWRRAPTTATKRAMTNARTATDAAYRRLKAALDRPPGGAWSQDVENARQSLAYDLTNRLPVTRQGADLQYGNLVLQGGYSRQLSTALSLTVAVARDLSTSAPDAQTVDAASTLGALAAAVDAASQQSVRLTTALAEGRLSDNTGIQLQELKVQQDDELALAYSHGTKDQRNKINLVRADDQRLNDFLQAALLVAKGSDVNRTPQQVADAAKQSLSYAEASGQRVNKLADLVAGVTTTTRDQAAANARGALLRTGLVSALALASLLLASALVTVVARTVTVPMRRLRAGAVDAATVRLPAMVRQIEREGPDAIISVPPVLPPGTSAGPETVEVAQAVDGLTSEAVRLATAQVRLRQALDEAFVSMSRRSQSMVEKQLAIIDELESTEEDPEQLRNLFRLDHLAARMRRYNDNLLVLAGSTLRTRSAAPVPIADVFRAATSEMEQYERVRLQPINGASVSGPVAGGLVHLLAELLDNAAMYSPPTSPILLAASLTPDGGLHLEITDSGVGIPASELADLNARLAMPGSIDTQVPSRMGLFVVARLAQRGGFSVRLSPRAQAAGTVA
ncbi:MAG TPA: ATP-binding protein, partial [Kineosporiaceae bacterium]|nr:ATP-binding protein [Kineosporiaceae bacterium]